MRRARIVYGAIVALLSSASPAAMQESADPRAYQLNWIIGPHAVPSADFWVRKQGQIVETRLLPGELLEAEAAVMAADGTALMRAGQQIVRLRARRRIACNIPRGSSGRAASGRVCLVDADDDGRFDSYFERGTGGNYWFELSGQIPERMHALAPATFRTVAPETMVGAPILTLHYQRILDGSVYQALLDSDRARTMPFTGDGTILVRFHFKVGTGRRQEWMTRQCQSRSLPNYCASAVFPSQFRFAGLVVDLLERRGEDIRMRVAAPFSQVAVRLADMRDGSNTGELILVDGGNVR